MAEKMEDTNSWNDVIFQQIRARKDWILNLIWRKRQELENETAHGETDEVEEKKNLDLDPEDPRYTKWCDERREKFENLLKKPSGNETVENKETNFPATSEDSLRNHPNNETVEEAKKEKSSADN